MSISKFNKNKKQIFKFKAPEGFEFRKMEDLYKANGPDHVYIVLGWFFHEGKFGEQPVFFTPDFYINGPKHLTNTCKEIQEDPDAVEQINAGQAGFKIREYLNSLRKVSYSIEWVDIPAPLVTGLDTSADNLPF